MVAQISSVKHTKMNWFLYILECKDGSLYTGITNNPEKRVWLHNHKLGAKSLLGKLPVRLVYKEEYETHAEAARREREIKGWKREFKLKLISRE